MGSHLDHAGTHVQFKRAGFSRKIPCTLNNSVTLTQMLGTYTEVPDNWIRETPLYLGKSVLDSLPILKSEKLYPVYCTLFIKSKSIHLWIIQIDVLVPGISLYHQFKKLKEVNLQTILLMTKKTMTKYEYTQCIQTYSPQG